jgi:hypothetical protein
MKAESLMKARGFPHGARTSFQRDVENPDKQDERDLFAGAMIRTAEQLGIETPEIRAATGILEQRKPAVEWTAGSTGRSARGLPGSKSTMADNPAFG